MPHSPLIRMFNCNINLTEEEEDAIRNLPMRIKSLGTKQDVVREGDSPAYCCVVLEGYACTYRDVGSGVRQVLSFHMAGDMPDLHSLHLTNIHNNIGSIGTLRVGLIANADLHRLCASFPRVAAALWRLTLIDASIYKEWISNIGARSARTRTAHLVCEVQIRQAAVGNLHDATLVWPMTQTDLANALGLSVVHVNRTLRDLKRDGLIKLERGTLHVPDIEALMEAGDFDPGYLHMRTATEREALGQT